MGIARIEIAEIAQAAQVQARPETVAKPAIFFVDFPVDVQVNQGFSHGGVAVRDGGIAAGVGHGLNADPLLAHPQAPAPGAGVARINGVFCRYFAPHGPHLLLQRQLLLAATAGVVGENVLVGFVVVAQRPAGKNGGFFRVGAYWWGLLRRGSLRGAQ